MTNYNFQNGSITDVLPTPIATPGDLSTVVVRRGVVDGSKQTLTAGTDVAQVFPVYAGEVILCVWTRVKTAETANAEVEVGIDAGQEFAANVPITTANAVVTVADRGYHVGSNAKLTLFPNNGVDMDAGVVEVAAMISKSFDNVGY